MQPRTSSPHERIIVALDVPDADTAWRLAEPLVGHVGLFKVGLELFVAEGPAVVRMLRSRAPEVGIFLDLKLHDIPNTMVGAVASARGLGAQLLTVHAGSGVAHLRACVEAAGPELGILAVTVLTSQDEAACREAGHTRAPAELVAMRVDAAAQAGCAGIVCSGQELDRLAGVAPELVRVVPGIRPRGADAGDQKRIVTPADAIRSGATYLVIGRPITQAPSPADAAKAIADEIAQAL